jgi:nitrate/nitrite transport system substrate-binding protein
MPPVARKDSAMHQPHATTGAVRIGFVPLLDAAPVIVAQQLGYFADEGLKVQLQRQIGWGNVRDKLSFGQLDASHALLGMPLASELGWAWYVEPLVSLLTLSTGGNAITLGGRLADAGVRTPQQLEQWLIGGRREDAPRLATVSNCSTHHYLLRRWLTDGGVDTEDDVRLCVVPPPQMEAQLQLGTLDGFCAGEPWNTLAARTARGRIVARTADIVPDHPEKILAVTRKWLAQNAQTAERLVRACVRGCQYCADRAHDEQVARWLSDPAYLGLSEDLLRTSMSFIAPGGRALHGMAPNPTHFAWLLDEMIAAGHAPVETDLLTIALACCHADAYRSAVAPLGLPAPADEWLPMRLRHGTYDPQKRQLTARQPFAAAVA